MYSANHNTHTHTATGTRHILSGSVQLLTSSSDNSVHGTHLKPPIIPNQPPRDRQMRTRECDSIWHLCLRGQREALKKLVGCSLELRLSDMGSSAGRRVFGGELEVGAQEHGTDSLW